MTASRRRGAIAVGRRPSAAFAAEGCSAPRPWGNGPGDTYGRHSHGVPQGAVLPRGLDHVPPATRATSTLAGRRPARPRTRDGARGDRRAARLFVRGGVEVKVAVHVDQLFFPAPGGIGTYIRNLVPAMAAHDPSLELVLFHSRFASPEPPERWMREFWVEELPASVRSLYPRWAALGRPALPPSLADRGRRPRDEPGRDPAGRGRAAAGRDGPRPRVRALPERVPAEVARAVPARAARGGPAGGRDRDAVEEHRGGRALAHEGRPAQAPRRARSPPRCRRTASTSPR